MDNGNEQIAETTKELSNYPQENRLKGFSIYNTEGDVCYRGEVERMVYELKRELYPQPQMPRPLPTPEKKEVKPVAKKKCGSVRVLPLVIILVINLLAVAVLAFSCLNVGKFGVALAPFVKVTKTREGTIPFFDSLFGMMGSLGLHSVLDYSLHTDAFGKVAEIANAASSVLFAVLVLVQVIVAIVGLARSKKEGKGVRFGVVAFLMLLSLVVDLLTLCALKAELGFGDLCSLVLPRTIGSTAYGLPRVDEGYTIYSGYGLYVLIVVPILTMILSACVRKKNK